MTSRSRKLDWKLPRIAPARRAGGRLPIAVLAAALALGVGLAAGSTRTAAASPRPRPTAGRTAASDSLDRVRFSFPLVRSASAEAGGCLRNAEGTVDIRSTGPSEIMNVSVRGLPKNTEFDYFVIQVPNAPFGLAWYQGDIETDDRGRGSATFIGRFSIETFIVAPGVATAPVVHDTGPFPDAASNPATPPVHTFHLGLWFNSPDDAVAAGCPPSVTPFNGDHTAGIQVLSTRNFPDRFGPLRRIKP